MDGWMGGWLGAIWLAGFPFLEGTQGDQRDTTEFWGSHVLWKVHHFRWETPANPIHRLIHRLQVWNACPDQRLRTAPESNKFDDLSILTN